MAWHSEVYSGFPELLQLMVGQEDLPSAPSVALPSREPRPEVNHSHAMSLESGVLNPAKPDHLRVRISRTQEPNLRPYLPLIVSGNVHRILRRGSDGRIYGTTASELSLGEPANLGINRLYQSVAKKAFDAAIKRHNIYVARTHGKISITYIYPDYLLTPFIQLVQLIHNLKKNWSGTITVNLVNPNYKVAIENDLKDKDQVLLIQSFLCFQQELRSIIPTNMTVILMMFANYADYIAKGEKFDCLVISELPSDKFCEYSDLDKGRRNEDSFLAELSMDIENGEKHPCISVSL